MTQAHFAFCVLLSALAAACAACTNPRKDPPPQPDNRPAEKPVDRAKLSLRAKQGQIIRVERTLRVREQTQNDVLVLEALESSLNEATLVDELGRALVLRRKIVQSLTRLGSEGGRIDETKNPLHGITLELRRDAGGLATATVVDGTPPAGTDVSKQKFLIDGFDAALLPSGEVKENDRWRVPPDELSREGGLNSLLSGFKIEKNELNVRVSELTPKRATLELDWNLTGSFDKTPTVMAFSGSLEFDRDQAMVTRFVLNGGRQAEKGFSRQISISILRSREVNEPPLKPEVESVMFPGMSIEATTATGTIVIRALDDLRREYTWEGATRAVTMDVRKERWYGSLGLYYPGPGDHWEEHKGITRGVVEEGQQHFDTGEEFSAWLDKRLAWQDMSFVWTDDGLLVGWGKTLSRKQLNVEVWQIFIGGAKPTKLKDSNNAAISVKTN
ncbi:MAG: hypothetical protein KBG84_00160 [Planctomycetes bacterium]|nr:hypothetical protein [Planctomycetota bacterium]